MSIIGEGSYGTIYKPPLPCKNSSATKKNSVGKVFEDAEDMYDEKEKHELVSSLDPEHTYTLPLYDNCVIAKGYQHQLIYKYGGKDLKSLLKTKGTASKFKSFIRNIGPLLYGIQTLARHKYVHLDIKPENILFKNNKIYLIDFGLTDSFKNVYSKSNNHILEHDYPYYPPEFKAHNYTSSFESFFRKYKRSLDYTAVVYNKKINYYKEMELIVGIDIKKELESMYKRPLYLPEKVDVFSLGIVLLLFYVWSGLPEKKYKLPSPNRGLKEGSLELIKGMVCLDPKKRYTIDETIKQYESLLSAI